MHPVHRDAPEIRDDLTLGSMLESVAYTRLPTQFYQVLQLAIPFSFQLWSYGLYRTAGWMAVVSLFGMWALCVKRLDGADPLDSRFRWLRVARSITSGVAAGVATVLAIEGVVRLMTFVFRCPGCAG